MPENELSQVQIDVLAERAIKFLSAASQVPSIRVLLDRGGYHEEEHKHGWELALSVLGYNTTIQNGPAKALRQSQATAELDAWDGENFSRARAALDHRFPAQSAYVFDNLSAKTGPEAIGAVRTFLDRVAALRDGSDPARADSRDADKAAAELLAARRIVDQGEEARLRALITEATSLAHKPVVAEPDPSLRQKLAKQLDAWLRDWRETARVLVTRRDYQIRLGLAERRAAKAEVDPAPAPELP
jgi:hypothetical protein